ncbi:hypothetical protein [Acinetobacter haemolyticus]|uniref:hypothetical protein n=1 Tax=Acinetobacter haemolyticus TaxID=29430 RepID=UPI001372AB4C|nr:hypothetical protein [Acinetobacter haemolyticus]NAR85835.1 hypothetical protein [Acinetobacter haemolyticus]NAR89847.1 hypothetical protein [Acinetobacter haemolyticus]
MFKSKTLIFSISTALLLISFSFFYRYVIYLPNIQEEKNKQFEIKQEKYDACIDQAYQYYNDAWSLRCQKQFEIVSEQNDVCINTLRNQGADYQAASDQCYSKYPLGDYAIECKSLPLDLIKDINLKLDKDKSQCQKLL